MIAPRRAKTAPGSPKSIRHRALCTMWSVRMPLGCSCCLVVYFLGPPPPLRLATARIKPASFLSSWPPFQRLDSSKTAQDGSRTAQDCTKTPQDGPRELQDDPKGLQDCPTQPQDGATEPQAAPGSPQDVPKRAPEEPRGSTNRRISVGFPMFFGMPAIPDVDASKTAQNGPKTAQDGP